LADEQVITSGRRGIKREDPPPRPVEQTANRGFLSGADPNKHYVWVSEVNDPTINVSYYRHLGYKAAQYDPSEAVPALGNMEELKQGDPIKTMGMVLMELPMERKRELDEFGPQGNTGQRAFNLLEEKVKNREFDPLTPQEQREFRGITSVRTEQDDRKRWSF
jgi:hypothetical protein